MLCSAVVATLSQTAVKAILALEKFWALPCPAKFICATIKWKFAISTDVGSRKEEGPVNCEKNNPSLLKGGLSSLWGSNMQKRARAETIWWFTSCCINLTSSFLVNLPPKQAFCKGCRRTTGKAFIIMPYTDKSLQRFLISLFTCSRFRISPNER